MSLNYDLRAVKDQSFKGSEDEWAVAQSIIFSCLSTGIGALTEANYVKAHARFTVFCRVVGQAEYLTLDDFRRYVGLTTNVFPEKTDAQWARGIGDLAKSEVHTLLYNHSKIGA